MGHAGGKLTLQIDSFPPFTRYFNGEQKNWWTMPGAPRWTASSPTTHTLKGDERVRDRHAHVHRVARRPDGAGGEPPNQPAFKATGVTGSIVVHPTADTYYTATNTCAYGPIQPGTPSTTTSSAALVTIGPSSTPENWYCFTVTTPGSNAMPSTCWAEAVPAPSESDAEAIEKARNQNATVDSLGQCKSIPTDACN
jgi:hypothetical protein